MHPLAIDGTVPVEPSLASGDDEDRGHSSDGEPGFAAGARSSLARSTESG